MKKFLNLFALVFCVAFFAPTITSAQTVGTVRNDTNCTFTLRITYAKEFFPCQGPEFTPVTVQAFSSQTFTVPADMVVIEASGSSQTSCRFDIGSAPCSTFPASVTVSCLPPPTTACNNYTAEWINAANPSLGVWIHN